MSDPVANPEDLKQAFAEHDRRSIINNVKIGCLLGVILMPLGVVLDHLNYGGEPEIVHQFLVLRLLCSFLIGLFWVIVVTPLGHKHPRKLGVTLAMFPTFFMALMIFLKDGPRSHYYAGLNLVLLVIGFVLYWTFSESFTAVTLVLLMYLAACGFHQGAHWERHDWQQLSSNLYFIALTGVIVVTGSYFHSKYRFREFSLRYELDRSRRALEEGNQKLLEMDQIKSRFFANISHELRTPLTLLLAPLEALLQRTGLEGETRDLLATMHASGMRLLKLINDLLDLVRLESGRMVVKAEPLRPEEFVKGLASAARQVADDKRLRLETKVDPSLGTLLADRDKLEKILLNLVFNALKFTPAGGRVELRAEKQGDQFVLVVTDTGMGISEKNLPHVFDRFWQADGSSKRKYQGVGIGLALVKELVEMQQGTVAVQSQEGNGTTFTVRLPYLPASTALPPSPIEPSADSRPAAGATSEEWLANLYRRAELFPALTPVQQALRPVEVGPAGKLPTLLVADDEPDMLRFVKSQLSSHYRVLEAVDGQQAIEKACQFLPDLILLDMMMPEKDGLQACRELREHTSTQNIPVILLTARADEETKLAALSAGANDFLTKPFSTTGLFTLRNRGKHLPAEEQAEFQEILNDVEEGVRRVKNIVSDLRMFTHPDTESRDLVEVAEVVTAALRFLGGEWRDQVQIHQTLAERQVIYGNKNKLIHLLVNLLQNSLDALKAKTFVDEPPAIWIEGRSQNGFSILVVRDNGTGVEAKHLDKIFDPFFTTKEVGAGMGLGLSICYRIVQECEGHISVRTEPGKFCEFTLEFPAHSPTAVTDTPQ